MIYLRKIEKPLMAACVLLAWAVCTSCKSTEGEAEAKITIPKVHPVILPEETVSAETASANAAAGEQTEGASWSPEELLNACAGKDSIEGFNRSMFACTDVLVNYVGRPIGWIWTTILPSPVIKCIDNACTNLEYPGRLVASLGGAEWKVAGVDTLRFLTNTTIGIAGLFDPAQHWFHLYPTDANFNRMFADWGLGPGTRFVIPLSLTTNVRDTTGRLFDYLLDIRTYLPYSSWASANYLVIQEQRYYTFINGSADPYRNFSVLVSINNELKRSQWYYNYANALHDNTLPEMPAETISKPMPADLKANVVQIPGYHSLGAELDTLRSVFYTPQRDHDYWYQRLSLFNGDFADDMSKRKVSLNEERSSMAYGFWDVPKKVRKENPDLPEQLVIIIPGIGGQYDGNSAMATAEVFNNAGYKAVTLDSTFCWRFMEAVDGKLPGFAQSDTANIRRAIRAVLDDLKEDEKISNPRIVLTGWSMGGLHTMHIASLEEKDPQLGIDRFVALNPPADLLTAAENADSLILPAMKWTPEEAWNKILNGAGMQVKIAEKGVPTYDPADPETFTRPPLVDETTADFFIAMSFRSSLNELLLKAHQEEPFEALKDIPCTRFHRGDFYRAIGDVGFSSYIKDYLMTRYPDAKLDDMAELSGLYALKDTLQNNPRVAMLHAWDDILLSDADRLYLDRTLGKKLTWFPFGGHCGEFYTKPFQDTLLKAAAPQK